jgi:uncharacterized membrane protein YqjE
MRPQAARDDVAIHIMLMTIAVLFSGCALVGTVLLVDFLSRTAVAVTASAVGLVCFYVFATRSGKSRSSN